MTRTVLALLSALLLTAGCSSANAACPGGNCSLGVWSPWGGAWYYASPCAGGRCQRPKLDEKTGPKEPENPSIEPECPNVDEIAPEPADPEPADTAPVLVEFKPFCLRAAELINAQRAALGLAPLELDDTLCAGCDSHSRYMASYGFVHAYGIGARECIASGAGSPEAVVNMWLGSSGHRAILLGPGRIVGIGRSGSFWTLRVR